MYTTTLAAGRGGSGDFVIFPDPRRAPPAPGDSGGIYRGKGMFRASVVVSGPTLSFASDFVIPSDFAIPSEFLIPSDFVTQSGPSPWPCDRRRRWRWASHLGTLSFFKKPNFDKYSGFRMTQMTHYFRLFGHHF